VEGWGSIKECIVFSTQGKRPDFDMMSGGDLDGDKYFVSFHPDLLPAPDRIVSDHVTCVRSDLTPDRYHHLTTVLLRRQ
jgi:hypothetical protein